MFRYGLGIKAADAVTGLEGIVTARAQYLNGNVCYCIQPPAVDHKPASQVEWVDEAMLVVIGPGFDPPEDKWLMEGQGD